MNLIVRREASWDGLRVVRGDDPHAARDHHDSGGVEVAVVGCPYDRRRIAWLTAEDIHRRYRESGTALVDDLEGSYAVIVLDRNARRCIVVVDPYKIFTLFHARLSGDAVIVSDSVTDIAPHLKEIGIDETAALEFFHFGFVLGDKTLIEGISAFRAGMIHTIDENLSFGERSYWSFTGAEGRSSAGEAIDAFNAHVTSGLSLSDRISMPLTGGLDSRTVLSACMPMRDRIHFYTHGRRSSDDARIARRISRRFGLEHDFYEIGPEVIRNIPAIASSMSLQCNGYANTVMSAHFIASFERERERGDLFFSGIGGELLRSYYVPAGAGRSGSLEGFAGALRRTIQSASDDGIYRGRSAADATALLDRSVREALSRYGTEKGQTLAESFYLENRVGNFLSVSMRILSRYFTIFNPFLERELLSIIPRLTEADKAGGELQRRIILHNVPELAHILMDRARIIDSSDSLALMRHLLTRPFVLARIYANKLTGRSLFNFTFTDYDTWLKAYHRDFVLETLDYDRMELGRLFDRDALDAMKRRFLDTKSNLLHFVTAIMSAEIFLRRIREAGR